MKTIERVDLPKNALWKPRPLLILPIRRKLERFQRDQLLLATDLGEIFYEFWRGIGLLHELVEVQEKRKLMGVIVDVQISLQHLDAHLHEALSGLNAITRMDSTKPKRTLSATRPKKQRKPKLTGRREAR
jgi:hypothetical protein